MNRDTPCWKLIFLNYDVFTEPVNVICPARKKKQMRRNLYTVREMMNQQQTRR